jgi:hypothetical protein
MKATMDDPTYVREEIDANPIWKLAFKLSELENDEAPIGWGEYIPKARHVLSIARTCHEVNRAYCAAIGDHSQVAWEEAPAWQRESAADGVLAIMRDPKTSPQQSHEGWSRHKVATGWVFGDVKDEAAKTHPCLVPYDQLPLEQRIKDYLFGAVVRSMLASPVLP